MEGAVVITLLSLIRIFTLSAERIAFHGLGRTTRGLWATMGIGFGGAAVILWLLAVLQGQAYWVGSTLWGGFIYALAFGFYTAALVKGPLSVVTPWSNATVLFLWLMHPAGGILACLGILLFAAGALLMTSRHVTTSITWMVLSDVLLSVARWVDVRHVHYSPVAYSASLFTVISLWMFIPIFARQEAPAMYKLLKVQPGWSFIAASSNAAAYVTLFVLLQWLHPAAVEAISALGTGATVIASVYVYKEHHAKRKIISSALMIVGTLMLLFYM